MTAVPQNPEPVLLSDKHCNVPSFASAVEPTGNTLRYHKDMQQSEITAAGGKWKAEMLLRVWQFSDPFVSSLTLPRGIYPFTFVQCYHAPQRPCVNKNTYYIYVITLTIKTTP